MKADQTGRWSAKLAALDANLLVALDALLQESNVTRAAERLGITQSAMSQTLGRLRDHFDDPILVRSGRKMQPTPFAFRIRVRLRAAVSELEALVRDRPDFEPSRASRRFVIATVDYLALLFIPTLSRHLMESGPGLDLAVYPLESGSVSAELEAGVVDLYLGIKGESERALSSCKLYDDSLCLLVHSSHPLAGTAPTLHEYASFPHVHVSPRRERGTLVGRALAKHGLERRVAAEVPFFSLVPELILGSDLIATVPRSLARLFETQYGLVALEPPIELPQLSIYMAWDPRFGAEPGLKWLRGMVEQTAGLAAGAQTPLR